MVYPLSTVEYGIPKEVIYLKRLKINATTEIFQIQICIYRKDNKH